MKKNLTIGIGMLLVLAAATGVVYAQGYDMVKATIPFAFTVKGETLPAGDYEVFAADQEDPTVWVIHSATGDAVASVPTELVEAEAPVTQTELVFDVIGQQHFLRDVWVEGSRDGREITTSKEEKALEAQGMTKSQHHVRGERAPRPSHPVKK